jgi:Ca2+-transporting ATPase
MRAPAQTPPTTIDAEWHRLSVDDVLRRVAASASGLDDREVARRLTEDGPNELERAAALSPLRLFANQFKSIVVGVLMAAVVVSGLLGDWFDCTAIASIVLLNGAIGFFQEYSAERALAALKRMTAPTARVRRGGGSRRIPANEVVVGDVLELEAGDLVSADARVIESASLRANEAALTGESQPVEKHSAPLDRGDITLADRSNMLYLGTSVASGRAAAVVVATAMRTEFGRILDMLATADVGEPTPLQEHLDALGKALVWCSLGLVALLFGVGLMRELPTLELFITSVSLAVAAVPEGLPAIVTIALALGVQRMAGRRALVRRLHAVETLGCTTVICADKTGTLTVGEMTVRALSVPGHEFEVTGEGYAPRGSILRAGVGASDAEQLRLRALLTVFVGCNAAALRREGDVWKVVGDPTEGALLTAGSKAGLSPSDLEARQPRVRELPFDSDRKCMTVIRRGERGVHRALVKGATDVLLEHCNRVAREDRVQRITDDDRREITARMNAMAERGMRVIAAAYRDVDASELDASADEIERDLVFAGLAGMVDPPRPEAKSAVALARSAGIRVVMITGDHPRTAATIARELGIARSDAEVMTGPELDRLSDEEFALRVEGVSVFARVTAGHKLRIVRAWKQRGAVVAMTGDGVNDAPAIRGADVGIAMGLTGTEVTKEASDMVITDDDFASIVAAVEQGRGTYDNIRKTLQYLLAGNVGELAVMASAVLLGLPLPLMPVQLLWINFVTDGLPALCLATDPIDGGVMNRRPRKRGASMTNQPFLSSVLFTGFLTAGTALAVYVYALDRYSIEVARAYAFTTLVYAELLRAFGARSATSPVWRSGVRSNLKLALVVAASVLIQFLLPHAGALGRALDVPAMPPLDCVALLAIGALPFAVLELFKLLHRSRSPHATSPS